MTVKTITEKERFEFNSVATHPLQAYEWGEFREKSGVKVIRRGFFEGEKIASGFQMTIHKIPKTKFTIGYLPKSTLPTKEMLEELMKIGRENKCIFIQIEPNIVINDKGLMIKDKEDKNSSFIIHHSSLTPSARPLFTKYTFQLDLTKSEEELLKNMHSKTRYNIKVAQKHEVTVKEEFSKEAFQAYLKLTLETTKRQGFFAHTPKYHTLMWETLKTANGKEQMANNKLRAYLLIAYYTPSAISNKPVPLTTWILFVFHDTLYYPYGASSSLYRETMSSNLMMWEAIRFGKKLKLKKFDMWGSLGENPDPKDPWYGFHRFKTGYSPKLVEFMGSYDLVINPFAYQIYKLADKIRWLLLKLKR